MSYNYDAYIDTAEDAVEEIENRIEDDDKYPVVENNKVKKCCHITLEFTKIILRYFKIKVDASQKKKEYWKKANPWRFWTKWWWTHYC